MNENSGNSRQLSPDAGSGGIAPIDVTDPWRGLYRAEHLRANGDGDMYHPDLPSWPDDREDALDKLVHAQGFDFQVVAGEFSDEAMEDGGDLYWQEMRAWNPEAPEGDWRLAWKGDTEDGPYAWFVRPMALRPSPAQLAAGEPVGQEPAMYADTEFRQAQSAEYMAMGRASKEGLWPRINAKYIVPLYTAPHAQADRMAIKMLVAAGFVSEDKANESLRIAHGFGGELGQPAPAAVPVDERQDAAIIEAAKLAYGLLWMGTDLTGPALAHRARVALRDALGKQACGDGITAARATHSQPAAAKEGPR